MYDLTIAVPGIRTSGWERLYNSGMSAADPFKVQFIFIGPKKDNDICKYGNVRYIEDYGAPCRCVHIASMVSEGALFMWAADDGYFMDDSLKASILQYDELATKHDYVEIIMRYFEGANFSGNTSMAGAYWDAHTHASLRLPGIPNSFKIAPLGMLSLKNFVELGGFDTRFEHINICCHDLAFRIQHLGGVLVESEKVVLNCDKEAYDPESPVELAFLANDLPLLNALYNNPNILSERSVHYNNWADTSPVWHRRFKGLQ